MVHLARALLPVIVVAAVTLPAAGARAEPPLRSVGPVSVRDAAVMADGERVAYSPAADRVRVIDERLAELVSVAEPGCFWRSFGGGALLWSCGSAPGYLYGYSVINDLTGGPRTVLAPPVLPIGAHGETPAWAAIGRRWLTVAYSADYRVYVNRRTAERVDSRAEFARAQRHHRTVTDLDQDGLTRRVCAPLVPKLVDGERSRTVAPLAYRSPYGATRSGTRLVMGRCGAARLSVLSRCPRTCSDPVVGDGFVAWMEGIARTRRTLYVLLADRGRTWRWRVRIPAQASERLVAAAGRRVFVIDDGTLKTVRLPAARDRR